MKIRSFLYDTADKMQKVAGIIGDVETLLSGNPKKIVRRIGNKSKNKIIYRTANNISRKVTKRK